jgi:hypothetical protein
MYFDSPPSVKGKILKKKVSIEEYSAEENKKSP